MRTIAVRVVVKCKLQPIYPGSPSEDISISVLAEAPQMQREEWTPNGWQSGAGSFAKRDDKSAGPEIVVHDRRVQQEWIGVMETLGAKWSSYPASWRLRVTKKTPELFVQWLKSLPSAVEVLLDKELATLRDEPVSGTVSLDVAENGIDWFDLKVALNIGDTTLAAEELKLLLNASRRVRAPRQERVAAVAI